MIESFAAAAGKPGTAPGGILSPSKRRISLNFCFFLNLDMGFWILNLEGLSIAYRLIDRADQFDLMIPKMELLRLTILLFLFA